jgi:uncharacterized Fe-S cluster protein YjdI
MNYYTVKQVAIPESQQDLPNQYGWGGATERSVFWKTKMDMQMVDYQDEPMTITDEQLDCYHDKFLVQAESLDHVFHITNLWDQPDAVHTYSPGHSTSVGDIIVDNATGDQYMVADYGFNKLAA